VSLCVRDSVRFADLPGTPETPEFGDCSQDSATGLSIGWSDYYPWFLEGQELDVTDLRDGRYCLRMTADPADRIRESDETNDARTTLLRLRGKHVTDLGRACRSAA
jgi:Lysyl oxidase